MQVLFGGRVHDDPDRMVTFLIMILIKSLYFREKFGGKTKSACSWNFSKSIRPNLYFLFMSLHEILFLCFD